MFFMQALPLSSGAPRAGWLTDKSLLTPLLTEYDNIIAQLQQKIATYQTEITSLNLHVEQVTTENTRLHQQLCESVETQLLKEGHEEGGRDGLKRSTAALQNQLSEISKERDECRGKLRQMTFELEYLQKSDREKSQCLEKYKNELATAEHNVLALQQQMEELQTACVKLNEEYNQCMESARSGGQEVDELKQALSDARVQCKALELKNTELLRAHSQLAQRIKKQETERQVLGEQGRAVDGRVHLLELANTELEAKLVAALSNVNILTQEKAKLEESVSLHQSRLAELEREVHQAVGHVKESMDMVESAILDKDQAVIVSEHKTLEAERLRAAMDALLQEAGQRTLREVEAVRADYNRNIDKMVEEIHKLEVECGEKQAIIERSQREKNAAEMECERAKEKLTMEAAKTEETLQTLQTRVCEAELAADEAHRKMDNALMAKRAAESSLTEEKRHHEELCGELKRRLREGGEEGERVTRERAQLAGQLRELMEQLRSEREARGAVKRKAKQELAVASQHYAVRERELQQTLRVREQSHNKSVEELRDMLTSQFQVATRWKEETKSMTDKFEETIRNLRNEAASYKKRNEAKKVEMHTLSRQRDQQSRQLERLQASQTQLHRQLRESESRAEAAAAQVSSLLMREKQLLADRRELQRQLDKLKLEITRRAGLVMAVPGSSSLPPPPPAPHPFHFPASAPFPADPVTPAMNLDGRGWESAIAGLRQSIRQARQQMEATQQEHHHTTASVTSLKQPFTDVGEGDRGSSPENSTIISENSSLHRTDLSPPPNLLPT
ncbi:Sodium channel and clathrin linker 1 [Geodia barretti]|uniref:Sodium channel and clathrin linker 1 n=1 Tax=Geodia barretti TaxID=519541 RepID=A0AA35W9G4_GEOBA|nr:Sodium channel and clathrin linker 1 [Geodia barretti]